MKTRTSSANTSAFATPPSTLSQTRTPGDRPAPSTPDALAARTLERRAVEATIWGMPAVKMAAIRESLRRDLDADFGDVIYFSNLMEPRHEFLTASNQTPYVFTFFDLRRGPMVLEVPPASDRAVLFGTAIDSWEVPLVDVGVTGEDGGRGAKYLFLPPDYQGPRQNGYVLVPSSTVFVHCALRPIPIRTGVREDAVAYSRSVKTYPLIDAGRPQPNRYLDAYPLPWKTLPPFDLSFFRLLAGVVDADHPQPKDAIMLAMLSSIGIEKGRAFQPDDARAQLLRSAVQEGSACMKDAFLTRALERFWPDRQWLGFRSEGAQGVSHQSEGIDYDRRAGTSAFWATWGPKRIGDPGRPPAFYLKSFRDISGEPFRGDRLYRVRVPVDMPAHDFWSINAYDVATNAFIHNPQNRVGLSSTDRGRMGVNRDGSVDVYVGPSFPEGLTDNWIPTAGRDFWLVARFHGPEQPLLEKTWVMPDVEEAP